MPRKPKYKLKGLTRIDSDANSTHGWYVRINYKDEIKETKFFTDNKYGGKDEAFAAAKEWLSTLRLKYAKVLPLKFFRVHKKTVRSNSTVMGVTRIKSGEDERYQASWYTKEGKKVQRSFSVRKYGEKEAFHLAWAARVDAEKKIYGR